ncbi:ABC-type Fe3+-siderophore transport system permease subunit [Thalassospira sp. MBR-102]|jgi:iron complex transport system permease protein|uniref:Fe(3+)-hydroxamate ABC transporter permease FhuB n=1 Tax=Thalassospira TaxID=168934 RepID=UPI0009F250BD|nr:MULTISPECIES: Fe(3+)-hydroxamate ABC transporter permease FhuB [Thalassospira]MAB33056.1 Fe(3+)-hydroxamate ABC transporter permease FhuB [Thalassospira sp.]MDM7978369.1 Fe(3+)-hydroxamate ABC transporter permease FhuB [Thalassospira xiamenensis]HBS22843.1 Fe(3+)-hydroxamate ABC transporter permease FhuB [Thalassospira sp.]
MTTTLRNHPAYLGTIPTTIFIAALLLSALSLHIETGSLNPAIIFDLASASGTQSLLLTHGWVPRFLISFVAGAGLATAGALFQHTLKNPLASPSTLGLAGGAKLFLTLATLYVPGALVIGHDIIALLGALVVGMLVFALARRSGFSPLVVILTGMIIGLYCGAVTTALAIIHHEWLKSLFIWGSGDLTQDGWYILNPLTIKVAIGMVVAIMLTRPLEMLNLNDHQATALGASPARLRMLCLLIGCWLTAVTVAAVGIVGFVGLAGPAITRMIGIRRLRHKLIASALFGALLLCAADQGVQVLSGHLGTLVPAGALTGVFGGPLLIILIRQLRANSPPSRSTTAIPTKDRSLRQSRMILGTCVLLAIAGAIFIGRDVNGFWQLQWTNDLQTVWPWRGPRILGAIAAGTMLAIAGTVLQRMTANPMASPESLGVSAGAAIGMIAIIFAIDAPSTWLQISGAAIGAFVTLVAIFVLTRKSGYAPERILIAGIAIGALFDGFIAFLMAGGDPRAARLLAWSSGSTYGLGFDRATILAIVAVTALPILPALARWLNLFPLGPITTKSMGVDLSVSRGSMLLFAAILTAAATLLVGPLSFAGLIAPHLARLAGFRHALSHSIGAAFIGAALMVSADWLGRMLFFPWEIPAGLMAAIIAGPVLVWLLMRIGQTSS